MLFFAEDGVLEKRACTLAIGVAGHDQHAFERANVAHGFARFSQIRRSLPALEMAFQIGVADARLASGSECIGHAEKDEASALGGIEDARAVAEAAGFGAELPHLGIFQV